MISRRALAPLSNASGSNPDPLGSSAAAEAWDSDLASVIWSGGGGVEDEEEEKKGGNRKKLSAYARSDSVDSDAPAAAIAAHEYNFEAAIGKISEFFFI